MSKRKIIRIDDGRCNGCAECIPNCPEGAIQIIDGKARLISDLFCDGLGACVGHCPQDAITIEERDAEPYDERKVMANIVKHGANTVIAHLKHLKEHDQTQYLNEAIEFLKEGEKIGTVPVSVVSTVRSFQGSGFRVQGTVEVGPHGGHGFSGCPGSRVINMKREEAHHGDSAVNVKTKPELNTWPIQIMLVPINAPYFNGADLLISADCVPFAYPNFHSELLRGKVVMVGCPKLDDLTVYEEKISAILKNNDIKSVTYAHMEVPCCFGMIDIVEDAIKKSKKAIPFKDITISISGEKRE